MTIVRAKIEVPIPRKRRGDCAQHEKGLVKFYEQIVQALLRLASTNIQTPIIKEGHCFKGTMSRDGYFFKGLNIVISLITFCVSADGFQGLFKLFTTLYN